jgi:tetratricopeptide (TPR) repeat protein
MNLEPIRGHAGHAAEEARRLSELARAAGFGDSPDDAIRWNGDALALLGTTEPTTLLVDVLRWQGTVFRDRGRPNDAKPLYQKSLELSRQLKYSAGIAHALNCLGILALNGGDQSAAGELFGQALSATESCAEPRLVGMIQQNLGVMADIGGNGASAMAHYRGALRTFEALNDRQQVCWVLNNLGIVYTKEGRYEEAHDAYGRALGIARDRGEMLFEGIIEGNVAELELIRGNLSAARPAIDRAKEIAERRNDGARRAIALKLLGAFHRMSGDVAAAEQALGQAARLAAVSGDALTSAEIRFQLACALAAGGRRKTAEETWTRSLFAFERMGARQWAARVRERLTAGENGRYF